MSPVSRVDSAVTDTHPGGRAHDSLRQAWPEVTTYAVVGLIGVYLVVTSFGYGLTADDSLVGAGTMPFAMGLLLAVLAVILSARRLGQVVSVRHASEPLYERGEGQESATERDQAAPVQGRSRRQCFLMVIATMAATIALTPLISMQLAFGLMVLWLAAGVERMRLRTSILVAILAVGISHLIFRVFLDVALPDGIWVGLF